MRIGIDIGGTNTDAVMVDANDMIIGCVKVPSTPFIEDGVANALKLLPGGSVSRINIGTTHALNAILQQDGLFRVGVIRVCGIHSEVLPSCYNWPKNLTKAIHVGTFSVDGGFECDGRIVKPIDFKQIRQAVKKLIDAGAESLAVIGAFSPLYFEHENEIANMIHEIPVALSHEIGGIGFIERENSTILNAALKKVMSTGFTRLINKIKSLGYECPIYISQNNGSVIPIEKAFANPILTLCAGSTNSFIGGARLSQLDNAIIVDIGGTSTDVGIIKNRFPRRSLQNSEIGGIKLNFPCPDVKSIGLGGGSIIENLNIGPRSIGRNLINQGASFGGSELTLTDVAIKMGHVSVSKAKKVNMPLDYCNQLMKVTLDKINSLVQHIDAQQNYPVVLVGGGATLIPREMLPSRYFIPLHAQVANAFGAALGQIGAVIDTTVCLDQREMVLENLKEKVIKEAGEGSQIVDMQIIPYHYMPGNKARVILMAASDCIE